MALPWTLLVAAGVQGQEGVVHDTTDATALVRTTVVSLRTIQGVVVDRSSGQPIPGAQIWFAGTKTGTLSDSLGRFTLEAPAAGEHEVLVQLIGYVTERFRASLNDVGGVAARVAMTVSDIILCPLSAGPPLPVGMARVVVRDVLTGIGPSSSVTIHVRGERGEWTGLGQVRFNRSVYAAAGEGTGPFEVEVQAAGYQPWARSGVVIETDECGITSPPLQAWLLPEGDVESGRP